MKIITVSREFGSGGRELGKRLADRLGYDYYDSEIISMVAENSGLDESYVETALNDHGWKNQSISYRGTLASSAYVQSSKVDLLLRQKVVIEQVAGLGNDCIIVGRNADVILREYRPFNIFVCASEEAKLERCIERAPEGETLSKKDLLRKMKRIDRIRRETREILTGSRWGDCHSYHLTVNTGDREIKDLIPAVAYFAECWFKNE